MLQNIDFGDTCAPDAGEGCPAGQAVEIVILNVAEPVVLSSGLRLRPRLYCGVRRSSADPLASRYFIDDGVAGIMSEIEVTDEVHAGHLEVV